MTPDLHQKNKALLQGVEGAVARACSMVQQGADIIDVGGQSTRPGATRLPIEEEVQRVVPVIRCLVCTSLHVHVSVYVSGHICVFVCLTMSARQGQQLSTCKILMPVIRCRSEPWDAADPLCMSSKLPIWKATVCFAMNASGRSGCCLRFTRESQTC